MRIRNTITLKDQMSTAFVYVSLPSSTVGRYPMISGAVNAGVPVSVLKSVRFSSARFEIPKSVILIHQSGPGAATNRF